MTTQGIVLTVYGRSAVGKSRTKNEDAFLVSDLQDTAPIHSMTEPVSLRMNERGILVAVSDGMGGAQAGEVASSLVLGALGHGMSTVQANSPDEALRVTTEAANQRVFDVSRATEREGMGATLTALLFHGIHAYTAEIGDSRAYLLRGNRMVQLTHDQSYVQQLIDAGALTPEESETSQFKNVILQAMGIAPNIVVALTRISVRRKDRFLVCSDGLSGKLTDQEMLNAVLGSDTFERACTRLIETAVEHGGDDDITVVLVEVNGDGAPAMTDAERLSVETSKAFAPA